MCVLYGAVVATNPATFPTHGIHNHEDIPIITFQPLAKAALLVTGAAAIEVYWCIPFVGLLVLPLHDWSALLMHAFSAC